jgi:arginine N-succinyltransferase
MWVVRPAQPDDLGSILHIVRTRGRGLSSTLPRESGALAARLAQSERSFADELGRDECGRFLFVLEETESNKVRGVSAIDARAGNGEPFYNYRRDCLIHASRELGISQRVEMLFPTHTITDRTLLCGFAIEADLVGTPAFQLLSRARLLFIAEHRRSFADKVAVEIQGVQKEGGQVPFWDSLGRHFFNMDFKTADHCSARLTKTFIAELMPPNPVYVTLLSEDAQQSLGQAHVASKPACKLLESEGFAAGHYVDIFDAGPVLEADTDQLHTLKSSRTLILRDEPSDSGAIHLIAAGQGRGFRAALGPASNVTDGQVTTSSAAQGALNCRAGAPLRVTAVVNESGAC